MRCFAVFNAPMAAPPTTTEPPVMSAQVGNHLLDIHAVANLLACSTRTINRLVGTGAMPRPFRIGAGLMRWSRQQLDEWITNGCRPT